jgi:hypothetical protein
MNRTIIMSKLRRLGLAIAVTPMLAPLQGHAETWAQYRDSTSDCQLEYPDALFTQEPLDLEEDIQRFSGPNEQTYFRVRAVDNQDRLTPAEIKARYVRSDIPGEVVYERTRPDFLVLSGYRDDSIFYTKIAVSADERMVCILEITYPRQAKREFDDVVTRMSRSFGFAS